MPTIGEELTHGSGGHDGPPQRPAEHVVVTQDRQQCPQRRRGQRQRNRDEGVHQAGGRQQAGDRDQDHGADEPAGHGQSPGPFPKVVELDS